MLVEIIYAIISVLELKHMGAWLEKKEEGWDLGGGGWPTWKGPGRGAGGGGQQLQHKLQLHGGDSCSRKPTGTAQQAASKGRAPTSLSHPKDRE